MIALLAVVFIVHVPSLLHPFFMDDYVYVSRAHDLTWATLPDLFRTSTLDQSASAAWWVPSGVLPFYRPIALLSMAGEYLVWRVQPFGYHLTNVLLHVLCTLLVYRLARRWFEVDWHALIVAGAFALHPVHGEAVMWISGRFDLLVCTCAVGCVLAYLHWSDSPTHRWEWVVLSLVLFVVGLGCKETALILPAVLAGLELYRGRRRSWRDLLCVAACYAGIAVAYMQVRIVLFGSIAGNLPPPYGLDKSSTFVAIKSLAWNLAQYLLDLALCIHIEPAYLPQFWVRHPFVCAAAVTISVLLLAWVALVGRSKVGLIGAAWLALFTAPSLLSMPGERNIYLGSVGLALMIGAAYRALVPRAVMLRRISVTVFTLWLVIGVFQQVLMGLVAGSADKVYRDLQTMLPDPPAHARIYVVHQNPLNAVGFTQAIRLRYGRPDLSALVLSVAPTMNASVQDVVTATGKESIRVSRENGTFFDSFVERFHRFSFPASTLADAADLHGLELLNPPASYGDITAMEFCLPVAWNDSSTLFFEWDNHRMVGTYDMLRVMRLTELRPCIIRSPMGEAAR